MHDSSMLILVGWHAFHFSTTCAAFTVPLRVLNCHYQGQKIWWSIRTSKMTQFSLLLNYMFSLWLTNSCRNSAHSWTTGGPWRHWPWGKWRRARSSWRVLSRRQCHHRLFFSGNGGQQWRCFGQMTKLLSVNFIFKCKCEYVTKAWDWNKQGRRGPSHLHVCNWDLGGFIESCASTGGISFLSPVLPKLLSLEQSCVSNGACTVIYSTCWALVCTR